MVIVLIRLLGTGVAFAGQHTLMLPTCAAASAPQGFPLSLHELLPLLSVIGTANKHLAKVGAFMSRWVAGVLYTKVTPDSVLPQGHLP
jgi:hypothetical protein